VSAPPARGVATSRAEVARFARFAVVGAIGFAVDAGVLTVLLRVAALGPYLARVVSFGTAVVCTYLLNSSWTFAVRDRRVFLPYLSVQLIGVLINYCAYAAAVWMTRGSGPSGPLIGLAIGSALALVWNYGGMPLLVFGGRR